MVWAIDLGVKYPFGFGGVYVRGRCVGVCHSMSPTSDRSVNMDGWPTCYMPKNPRGFYSTR